MGHGRAHSNQRFSLEAAAHTLNLRGDRGRSKAVDPTAADFVGLPGRIHIGIFHFVYSCRDHPAD
jgi:hypothetical protein